MSNIALITGASRGLGRSMALHLADQGRDIILTYLRKKEEAETVVAAIEAVGRRAVALQLDVAQAESFDAFAERVKVVLNDVWHRDDFDYLVNNAGSGTFSSFMETAEAEFTRMEGRDWAEQ